MGYLIPWRLSRRDVLRDPKYDERPADMLSRSMDRLFKQFFHETGLRSFEGEGEVFSEFYPRIDMTEDEKSITLTAELPGMEVKDIEISLTKDVLTIKGEKKSEQEEKGRDSYYMERSFGSFQRTFPISEEVNTEKADAVFKKGVLHITLPKMAPKKSSHKKIKVKSA
ncbi:MAG: Hsp20/alpha crystallin family protein [Deltaproteobacteria bacterium]|nr:Hsp20/alpha crystallin family protein [Deltaproteobacteria bacterium]